MKILWTDGSANPNPGPGGYVVILQTAKNKGRPVRLGRKNHTTNIEMEGSAILSAIDFADGEPCEIHTDSQFWINVLTKWAPGWAFNGWRKKGGPIKNLELVKKLYRAYCDSDASLVWVKGHAGRALNEMADRYAKRARIGTDFKAPQA